MQWLETLRNETIHGTMRFARATMVGKDGFSSEGKWKPTMQEAQHDLAMAQMLGEKGSYGDMEFDFDIEVGMPDDCLLIATNAPVAYDWFDTRRLDITVERYGLTMCDIVAIRDEVFEAQVLRYKSGMYVADKISADEIANLDFNYYMIRV